MPEPVRLVGFGAYTPSRVMSNDEWAQYVDTNDEWIQSRTGIRTRRIAAEDESTADLATAAARDALQDAGIEASALQEIIVATDTPEVYTPDTASFVQHRLGAGEIPCYDLGGSGCAGFLQGVDIARSRILTGRGPILVIGAELITRLIDWHNRNICVLFGDAAGAAIVDRSDHGGEILAATAGTDGSCSDILILEAGGTRVPFSKEVLESRAHKNLVMQGREVFRHAVHRMSTAARQLLEQTGKTTADLDLVIPHQANLRILQAVGKALDVPMEKVFVNVDEYGNTGSATVPLALCQAHRAGRISDGDLVLLVSFGAGFHWAATLLQF